LDSSTAREKIRRVVGYGHVSVVEHASFTFSVEGVSRAMTHQLVRHRIASYTQQSQRYVAYDTLEKYVVPPSIEKKTKAKKIFENALGKISDAYRKLLEMGISKEDARFILPNAAKTNIMVTMNTRELLHFFSLRCCARAQWEIREAATEMLRQARRVAPALFENAGPSCIVVGFCREGKMKPPECNIEDIRKRFRELQ
jgi:thymidylate synthase (FAD)